MQQGAIFTLPTVAPNGERRAFGRRAEPGAPVCPNGVTIDRLSAPVYSASVEFSRLVACRGEAGSVLP
jgi:hypothetical protein